MSKSPQTAYTRIAQILQKWPVDHVRPEPVSIQHYLRTHLPKAQGGLSESPSPSPISDSSINALNSLLKDTYSQRYPLSRKLRFPASKPDHYDVLLKEFEEAPTRTWFQRIQKRFGGFLRLK
ncbi:Pc22g03930 [Talaromyces islandicus]|uniref:Pc22g03930 n=1 Tax=Talaromyces islandicus TaxID=28573 RepID=A0A0U1LW22_TALIS|nr:Pc22g03930 [Talaromyces islandicus]